VCPCFHETLSATAGGAPYLHRAEAVSGIDDHILGSAVFPRFQYCETKARGIAKKSGLGCHPELLAGGDADGLDLE
jgi:hypothetical protein